jgi:hypothetical protein
MEQWCRTAFGEVRSCAAWARGRPWPGGAALVQGGCRRGAGSAAAPRPADAGGACVGRAGGAWLPPHGACRLRRQVRRAPPEVRAAVGEAGVRERRSWAGIRVALLQGHRLSQQSACMPRCLSAAQLLSSSAAACPALQPVPAVGSFPCTHTHPLPPFFGRALQNARQPTPSPLPPANAQALSCWLHVVVVRTFVESILRYGLPPAFLAAVVRPSEKGEAKLRAVLAEAFGTSEPPLLPWRRGGAAVVLRSASPDPPLAGCRALLRYCSTAGVETLTSASGALASSARQLLLRWHQPVCAGRRPRAAALARPAGAGCPHRCTRASWHAAPGAPRPLPQPAPQPCATTRGQQLLQERRGRCSHGGHGGGSRALPLRGPHPQHRPVTGGWQWAQRQWAQGQWAQGQWAQCPCAGERAAGGRTRLQLQRAAQGADRSADGSVSVE